MSLQERIIEFILFTFEPKDGNYISLNSLISDLDQFASLTPNEKQLAVNNDVNNDVYLFTDIFEKRENINNIYYYSCRLELYKANHKPFRRNTDNNLSLESFCPKSNLLETEFTHCVLKIDCNKPDQFTIAIESRRIGVTPSQIQMYLNEKVFKNHKIIEYDYIPDPKFLCQLATRIKCNKPITSVNLKYKPKNEGVYNELQKKSLITKKIEFKSKVYNHFDLSILSKNVIQKIIKENKENDSNCRICINFSGLESPVKIDCKELAKKESIKDVLLTDNGIVDSNDIIEKMIELLK